MIKTNHIYTALFLMGGLWGIAAYMGYNNQPQPMLWLFLMGMVIIGVFSVFTLISQLRIYKKNQKPVPARKTSINQGIKSD